VQSELRELLGEARDAKRRRPHVGAAPVAAEIERHADDVDSFIDSVASRIAAIG
jgi:hypothetical protein